MNYSNELGAFVKYDDSGKLVAIDYRENALVVKAKSDGYLDIAAAYLTEVMGLERVSISEGKEASSANFKALDVKETKGTVSVEFGQQTSGLSIWRRGVRVMIDTKSKAVLAARFNDDANVSKDLKIDRAELAKNKEKIGDAYLKEVLAAGKNLPRAKQLEVLSDLTLNGVSMRPTSVQPMVYRYQAAKRTDEHHHHESEKGAFLGDVPRLALPPTSEAIKEGGYYAVNEVLFTVTLGKQEQSMHCRALIYPQSNEVLYFRALVAHATGLIYSFDPITTTGDLSLVPGAPLADFNALRTPRPLPGIPAGSTTLSGNYVEVVSLANQAPLIAPPTSATGEFDYDVDTDDFSAVNAYFHSDAVFRMVEEFGFNMATYFDGTSFPVPVDHRGKCGNVNAKAPGNVGGNGSGGFVYGLVQTGTTFGIADTYRVVLHEFGHAILWDNVSSPNFGFAHSCGDSLAVLLGDPCSEAPDRGMTFPWLTTINPTIDRRHDRDPASGFAWGGVDDDGAYGSEQILSSTLFRAYLALGGGSEIKCERIFASRWLVNLVLHAVGTLTPVTNPGTPEEFAADLINCDFATLDFEGQPGRTTHKVIRWAFQQQGAYQPAGAPVPVTTPGAAPKYDVYIDDGRAGSYEFSKEWCHSTDIWNRWKDDGGAAHQPPVPGQTNYAYVVIRNCGLEPIKEWIVRGFHKSEKKAECCSITELVWKDNFQKMGTDAIKGEDLDVDGYAIVGPFKWEPGEDDCMLFSVSAKGDPSNIDLLPANASLPLKHLVPFDNNIAIRCECQDCACGDCE